MKYITTTGHKLTRKIFAFSKKLCKDLNRSEFKLISNLLLGILKAQNCKISEIARSLNEKILLKKTIERLCLGLKNFCMVEKVTENFLEIAQKHIKEDSLLIIDGGDLAKPKGEKFEKLGWVRDGSTDKIVRGYASVGVVALTEKKLPITVYEKIYSHEEKDFSSENTETIIALRHLKRAFFDQNTRVFDRGYDCNTIFSELIESHVNFIIRMKQTRDVYYKGKKINILKLANCRKGKYVLKFKKRNRKEACCKVSILPIELPAFPGISLNLVVCRGFSEKPLMLITNITDNDKKICVSVTKAYLMRWRIEEFYRLKKDQFGFEDVRVRSLSAIRNLSMILNFALGFLAILGDSWQENELGQALIFYARKIYKTVANFCLYSLARGIKYCFSRCNISLYSLFKEHNKFDHSQLSFFSVLDSVHSFQFVS